MILLRNHQSHLVPTSFEQFEKYVLYKFKEEKPFTIVKDNDTYTIKGDIVEKLFRMTNFNTEEAYERP